MTPRTDNELASLRAILGKAQYASGEMTMPEQIDLLETACLRLHGELHTAKAAAILAKSTPPPAPPALAPAAPAKAASAQAPATSKPLFGTARTAAAIAKANP